jgi:hypothetical protein
MRTHGLTNVVTVIIGLICTVATFGAEPAATIVAVEGNVVTIADAAGRTRRLEIVDTKGLMRGGKISWCEDDCRSLRTAERSFEVRRVLTTGQ